MRLKFHPAARRDLRNANAFYQQRSSLAAVVFGEEIERAVAAIVDAPGRYPASEYGVREYVLPWRFPYTVVYDVDDHVVVVLAFAHHSRKPGYWRSRMYSRTDPE